MKKKILYRKASTTVKESFEESKGKHNVSMTFSNETNTKNTRNLWLKKNPNVLSELQFLPKHIEDGQFKYLKMLLTQ